MATENDSDCKEHDMRNNVQGRRESIEGIENVLHTLSSILSSSSTRDHPGPVATTSKTSTEILSELFSSFNAEPPNLPETFQDSNVSTTTGRMLTDSPEGSSEDDTSKKNKSNRKKHKHKSKKHKKKSKREKSSSKSIDLAKLVGSRAVNELYVKSEYKKQSLAIDDSMPSLQLSDNESVTDEHHKEKPELQKFDSGTIFSENTENSLALKQPITENQNPKTSTGIGKISIKNLKFSSVFEATLREVEQQAKEKADKYEEGEISNSSEAEMSPRCSHESEDEHSLGHVASSETIISRVHSKHHRSCKSSERKSKSERNSSKRYKESKGESKTSAGDVHHKSKKSTRHRGTSDRHVRDDARQSRSRDRDRHSGGRGDDKHSSNSRDQDRSGKSREDRRRHGAGRSCDEHEIRSKERASNRKRARDSEENRISSSHSRDDRSKKRYRSHSKSPSFDKQKLMEIARKNALSLLKHGVLPGALGQDKMVSIKSGGKSVEELTNFCKRLSKKETGKSDSELEEEENSESETERPFNHPFQIKERPLSIVMNIRNSTQLPVKSLQEKTAEQSKILRVQFPVSSGQQHRKTESEWVPVEPKPSKPKEQQLATINNETSTAPSIPTQVFPTSPSGPVKDIGNIVTQRLRAMRKLQENPHDIQALTAMYSANQDMQTWAESKQLPGQFTGSTGVRVLSVAELSSGTQAYAKKNQLVSAAPVSGGMGMSLLQKMGWRPGEGLGKNKGGSLEPLSLEIKMDKRGLVTQEDLKQVSSQATKRAVVRNLSEKHPISVLIEFCARRRWKTPAFEMCHESGPDHKKNFLFKVQVNGVEYQPVVTSSTKKLAKADAASVCLRALGVVT